jgi:hypothetical protein
MSALRISEEKKKASKPAADENQLYDLDLMEDPTTLADEGMTLWNEDDVDITVYSLGEIPIGDWKTSNSVSVTRISSYQIRFSGSFGEKNVNSVQADARRLSRRLSKRFIVHSDSSDFDTDSRTESSDHGGNLEVAIEDETLLSEFMSERDETDVSAEEPLWPTNEQK